MLVQQISGESRENGTRTCDDRIALECSLLLPCTRKCVKQISSSVVSTLSALRQKEQLCATRVHTVFPQSEQSYRAFFDRPRSDQTWCLFWRLNSFQTNWETTYSQYPPKKTKRTSQGWVMKNRFRLHWLLIKNGWCETHLKRKEQTFFKDTGDRKYLSITREREIKRKRQGNALLVSVSRRAIEDAISISLFCTESMMIHWIEWCRLSARNLQWKPIQNKSHWEERLHRMKNAVWSTRFFPDEFFFLLIVRDQRSFSAQLNSYERAQNSFVQLIHICLFYLLQAIGSDCRPILLQHSDWSHWSTNQIADDWFMSGQICRLSFLFRLSRWNRTSDRYRSWSLMWIINFIEKRVSSQKKELAFQGENRSIPRFSLSSSRVFLDNECESCRARWALSDYVDQNDWIRTEANPFMKYSVVGMLIRRWVFFTYSDRLNRMEPEWVL